MNYGHYRGRRCFRHGGLGLSSDTRFDLFVDDNIAFISYVNYYEGSSLSNIVMSGYDDILQEFNQDRYHSTLVPQIIDTDSILGTYHHKSSGRLISIIQTDRKYYLVQNDSKFELFGKATGQFYYTIPFNSTSLNVPVIYVSAKFGSYLVVGGTPYQGILDLLPIHQGELEEYCGFYVDKNNYNLNDRIEIRWNQELGFYQVKEFGHQDYTNIQKIGEQEYISGIGTMNFHFTQDKRSFQLGYSVTYQKYA